MVSPFSSGYKLFSRTRKADLHIFSFVLHNIAFKETNKTTVYYIIYIRMLNIFRQKRRKTCEKTVWKGFFVNIFQQERRRNIVFFHKTFAQLRINLIFQTIRHKRFR